MVWGYEINIKSISINKERCNFHFSKSMILSLNMQIMLRDLVLLYKFGHFRKRQHQPGEMVQQLSLREKGSMCYFTYRSSVVLKVQVTVMTAAI